MIPLKKYVPVLILFFCTNNLLAQPTITSFSPTSGPVGTTVTITGTNFDATPANNIVYFGAVKATVSSAFPNQLVVTVPAGSGFQPLTVTSNNLTAYSTQPFVVTFYGGGSALTSTSFAPRIDQYTATSPNSIAIGDIDGDGLADIIETNQSSNTVSVMRNTSTPGNLSFASRVDFTTSAQPHSVAVGDIDGDGKLDIAVANYSAASVSILKNMSTTGTVSFAAKVDYSTGTNPTCVAIADLNADGKPEVVASNSSTNNVSVFRNTGSTGSISFAAGTTYATGGNPNCVALGDVDGDGKADIVTANSSVNTISILRNTTSGAATSFAAKVDYATGTTPQAVAIGDINEDGKADIAVANLSSASSTVSVFKNNCSPGTISFAAKTDFSTGANSEWVSMADADGDGKPDLATANSYFSSTSVSVLRNTTNGGSISFASRVDYPTGNFPVNIALNDLDGDSKPEIAAVNFSGGTVSVFRNRVGEPIITSFSPTTAGTGMTVTITGSKFTGATAVAFGGIPASSFTVNSSTNITAVVAGGASGNVTVTSPGGTGSLEGFTYWPPPTITSFTPTSGSVGASITITGTNFTNNTTASFGGTPALSSYPTATAVYATLGNGSTGNVTVTTQYGTASVPGFTYIPPPVISSFTPVSGAVGSTVTITGTNFGPTISDNNVFFGAVKATIAAASNNSITAIVPAGATYQPITVTANHLTAFSIKPFNVIFSGDDIFNSSSFAPKIDLSLGGVQTLKGVAIGDLDGDGKSDVVVANRQYNNNSISIFRNTSLNNAITFAAKIDYPTNPDPYNVCIGDLDGDNKPDIVIIISTYTSKVSVLQNTSTPGTISFSPKTNFETGEQSEHGCIADINGDGKPDIIVANSLSHSISILKNTSTNGTISFAPKVDYTVGGWPEGIAVADLDGDGKPDIAVANSTDSSISLLRNTVTNGLISFASKFDIPCGSTPIGIAVGDLNKDGRADIAVTNAGSTPGSNVIAVLKNITQVPGTFAFNTPVKFAVDSIPLNLAITDLDGDDYPDLAVSANSVSVLRNTTAGGIISFASKVSFAANTQPYNIAAGDLNNDGKPDLVTATNVGSSVSIFKNQIPIVARLCPGGNTSFTSNVTGSSYQWQVNTGSGFTNISNNANYSGANTINLQLNNIPSSWYGYQYRCVVNGSNGDLFTIRFANTWTGSANSSWENPSNWSCGIVPETNTDVFINSGTVVVNVNGICRTLNLAPGVTLTVNAGVTLTVVH